MLRFLRGAVGLLLLLFVLTGALVWGFGQIEDDRQADAAIVLGAGSWHGSLSPVFTERLNHAVDLYREGKVSKVILTGGYGVGNNEADSAAAERYVVAQGVSPADVLTEEKSTNSAENLLYAREVMEENGLKSALIVSDPLHMLRSVAIARDDGIEAYSSPTPTTRYVTLKTQIPFLLREDFYFLGYQAGKIASAGNAVLGELTGSINAAAAER